jgi:CubicO group peptidase (beta-lactamase class C family)
VKPLSSFRSKYSYSNFGLTEAAVAAAKAAGMSWEDASEAKLYKPLGMSSTSSRYEDFLTRSNRASLHVTIEGKMAGGGQARPRSAITGRRGQLQCARPGPVASARAR